MGIEGVEYGSGLERFEDLLGSVDRPGNYGDRLYLPMPRVVVDGVGELSFPVPPAQIEALIGAAQRAPFGKGTRTLVDASVRDCWQIDGRKVRLAGRAWPDSLAKVMGLAAEGLGLPAERLRAELYKLLVYRRGGFFAEHRDTEKVAGMVATLSLSLPAAGSGGEIVVRHGDRETTLDSGASEPSELAFAAFYADCPHEVLPVTEGHRVSLVYNLFLDSASRGLGAPDYGALAAPLAACLAEWRNGGDVEKMVWLLDHQYSEEGLSFETLKNTDAAVARVLGDAADRADCELYAAVLRIEEYGTPEYHWGWDDDDPDAVMDEVFDRWLVLDAWAARDGSRPSLGEIQLNDGELLPSGALDDAEPDDSRLEDSTGNEGPTLEFIYRLAALVAWPREKAVDVVAGAGIDHAVTWAAGRCAGGAGGDSGSSLRILARLVELWPVEKENYGKQDRGAMLRLLAEAGAADLAVEFLRRVVTAKYDGSENEALAEIMPMIRAAETSALLIGLVEEHLPERPAVVVELLTLAEEVADQAGEAEWRGVLREPVRLALTGLHAALAGAVQTRVKRKAGRRSQVLRWGSYLERDLDLDPGDRDPAREWIDDEAVRDLFLLARPLDLAGEVMTAAQAIGEHPQIVTPGRMLPAALEGMHEDEELAGSSAYVLLWRQAVDFVLERSSDCPSEPSDWTIAAEIPRHCKDCTALRAFCRDPAKQVGRFSVRKDRRKHLHRIVDGYGLDLDHSTERSGSPYTLVCTKNRSGFRRRLREYAEDVRWMDSLSECPPHDRTGTSSSARVARLAKAVAAGETGDGRRPSSTCRVPRRGGPPPCRRD